MSYEGETLDACGLQVDLSEIAIVAVSGSIPNVWNSYSNCPVMATDVPQHAVRQFVQTLEGEIYRLYGAPR